MITAKIVFTLTGSASHVSIGRGSSVQYMGSDGCKMGGRGGGGSRNSGGGPGQSHSAAVSMPHMASRSGGGSSPYSRGLSIDLTQLLKTPHNKYIIIKPIYWHIVQLTI